MITNGVHIQEPQSYDLPNLDNGSVEVTVELGDEMNSRFTLNYDHAEELYQKGLLIYLDLANEYNYNDQFIYFVSGKKTTCYGRTAESDEWALRTEMPSLKAIPLKENPGFVVNYSGWKENKWVVNEIGSESP